MVNCVTIKTVQRTIVFSDNAIDVDSYVHH